MKWRLFKSRMRGGITPETRKRVTLRSRVMPMPLPEKLILPLRHTAHHGAVPIVAAGDHVLKYQRIAEADSELGAAIHAPTSGRISAIEEHNIHDHEAGPCPCLVLIPDGDDKSVDLAPVADFRAQHPQFIYERLLESGLLGHGSGTPLAAKLAQSKSTPIDTLIINAVESEPYVCADEAMLREFADDVVQGAAILQFASAAERCIIACQSGKPGAIAALRNALVGSTTELEILAPGYPRGEEKLLVDQVTGREVPSGQSPAAVSCLVFNAGTARAACLAINQGQPAISRVVTLAGAALRTPKNFEALFGTPVSHLIELCGPDTALHSQTLTGGPFSGTLCSDLSVPVSARLNCVIAATDSEFPAPEAERDCIRCGECIDACPVRLQPQLLYQLSRERDAGLLASHGLDDCIECGACAYVCPSHIPLTDYFRAGRELVQERRQQAELSAHWQDRFQFHQYRLKKDRQQKPVAVKTNPHEKTAAGTENTTAKPALSREAARADIAAAVARVKARRDNPGDKS